MSFPYTESYFVVAAAEICTPESIVKFAEITIEKFILDSIIKVDCLPGYKRSAGSTGYFQCKNSSGKMQWINNAKALKCIGNITTSEDKQNAEEETSNRYNITDYCGSKSIKHARVNIIAGKYPPGQELLYVCKHGCKSSPQCSGTIRCIQEKGMTLWEKPSRECVDSGPEDPSPSPKTPSPDLVPRVTLITAGPEDPSPSLKTPSSDLVPRVTFITAGPEKPSPSLKTPSSDLVPWVTFIAAASSAVALVIGILLVWILCGKQQKKKPLRENRSTETEKMVGLA
ncbi:uncharacterized protein LOC115478993 [Microcaecilia unicolor]|uniref:Interleukin-2 receptor subunit alpha n=1 Tax=Microcaecilia unicolor TaxID=1415580 RepID=A0A6P7Z7E9_9AMPH|nr:uncharacterized protein LOC115478993 [Microcaecilia unicolor]